jgi:hypothetical protein
MVGGRIHEPQSQNGNLSRKTGKAKGKPGSQNCGTGKTRETAKAEGETQRLETMNGKKLPKM